MLCVNKNTQITSTNANKALCLYLSWIATFVNWVFILSPGPALGTRHLGKGLTTPKVGGRAVFVLCERDSLAPCSVCWPPSKVRPPHRSPLTAYRRRSWPGTGPSSTTTNPRKTGHCLWRVHTSGTRRGARRHSPRPLRPSPMPLPIPRHCPSRGLTTPLPTRLSCPSTSTHEKVRKSWCRRPYGAPRGGTRLDTHGLFPRRHRPKLTAGVPGNSDRHPAKRGRAQSS